MNNYGVATADRFTHLKIVAVALIAGIAFVSAGMAARPELPDTNARLEVRKQIMVAEKPVLLTSVGGIIR